MFVAIHHLVIHLFSTSYFLYKSSVSVPMCISIGIYLCFLLMSYTFLSICIAIYFYVYTSSNYLLISVSLEQFGTRLHISYLSARSASVYLYLHLYLFIHLHLCRTAYPTIDRFLSGNLARAYSSVSGEVQTVRSLHWCLPWKLPAEVTTHGG